MNFGRIRKEKKSFEFEFIKKKFLSFYNPFVLFRCTWRGEREKKWVDDNDTNDACSHYFLSLIHVRVKEHSNHITFSSSWSWEFSSSKSCEKDMKEYGLSVIISFHLRLWYCWKNFINRRRKKRWRKRFVRTEKSAFCFSNWWRSISDQYFTFDWISNVNEWVIWIFDCRFQWIGRWIIWKLIQKNKIEISIQWSFTFTVDFFGW